MDNDEFYKRLYEPIERRIGPIDTAGIIAIVGFDCGGPVGLCTVGRGRERCVTYITNELALQGGQRPSKCGQYELMLTCDNESWAHRMLTLIGRMSLGEVFEHGHTVDISQVVKRGCPYHGLVIEEFARVKIGRRGYGILRLHGVMDTELQFARKFGTDELLRRFKRADIYPCTRMSRKQSLLMLMDS